MIDPADRYRERVDQLAAGREIAILDDLAHLAVSEEAAFAQQLEALRGQQSPDLTPIETFLGEPWGEELFAVGLALVPYGSAAAHVALVRALGHLARQAVGPPSSYEPYALAGVPVIARIAWGWTAQSLANDALSFLPCLRGAMLSGYSGQPPVEMVRDRRLRYPSALGGHAGKAFAHYRDWLTSRAWLAQCAPYLADDATSYLGEADLLLALAALEDGHRVFAAAATNDVPVRLLAGHILGGPDQVAAFLGVPAAEVVDTAIARWDSLEHSGQFFDRVPLAPLLGRPEP